MSALKNYIHLYPLRVVLVTALLARLVATIFAEGYLMIDDHFLVIEPAGSWIDGEDYNSWLPANKEPGEPASVANFTYVSVQYVLLAALKWMGMDDPKRMMLVVRFFHALYSLLIPYLGFKIAERLSNTKTAFTVGMLLALFAFMPNFSVRNLVEVVCVPPLLWATYLLLSPNRTWKHAALAGIGIGIATGIRYQCGLYGIGIGLVLLGQRAWRDTVLTGVSSLFFFFISQVPDLVLWGKPFVQLQAYISYNSTHAGDYPEGPWYQYIFTILGFLLPPLSIALVFGSILAAGKKPLLVLPSLLFLVFHSIYPNKQERFIIPVLIFFIIAGIVYWSAYQEKSTWWARRQKLLRGLWISFWVLNTAALAVISTSYTKKSRVEAMYYLYHQEDFKNFVAVFIDSAAQPPQFYSGHWQSYYWFKPGETDLQKQHSDFCDRTDYQPFPNYVLFYGSNPQKWVDVFQQEYPSLTYQTTILPGYFDRLLHTLNPKNTLETVHIYSMNPLTECP
ncbi:MAG: hypothetical protein RL226_1341 [Bacteroidota bacterium]